MINFWSKFHVQILWYSFNRENRFPLTTPPPLPHQYLQGKQKNSSSGASRHINNNLSEYLFLESEINNGGRLLIWVKRAFKSYFFVTKKRIRKQTGSAWNFLQPTIQVCRVTYTPGFKINVSTLRSESPKW